MSDHLTPTQSSRGFATLPDIAAAYGGHATVRESSSAEGPHLWLTVVEPKDLNAWATGDRSAGTQEATLHLSADSAWKLKEQLEYALEHHYQGDARPRESGD